MSDFTIFAPASGQIMPLEQVPDPAFAEKMLGDGLAIAPNDGIIAAPFDGVVTHVHDTLHAITLRNENVEILIHVGVESVALKGKGFQAHVKTQDTVKCGQKLLSFDPELLAKKTPCNWVIVILTSPEAAPLQKTSAASVHAGKDALFSIVGLAATAQNTTIETDATSWVYSKPITISNANGLHARPAAALAKAAKKYPFCIEVQYQSKHADIKSLVAVMGLGLSHGAEVRLRINDSCKEAKQALEELTDLLISGLEEPASEPHPSQPQPVAAADAMPATADGVYRGLTACRGLALGSIWQWVHAENSYAQTATDSAEQQTLLTQAIQAVSEHLAKQVQQATSDEKSILQAHQQLLQDPLLLQHASQSIANGKSAPAAFNDAIRNSIDVIKSSQNKLLAERIADLKDIRQRVLQQLTGQTTTAPQFPADCIVVAEELLPSDVTLLNKQVQGVILAGGSPTAHAGILLRNKGIPSLVAVGPAVLELPNQTPVILNASEGFIKINPSKSEQQQALKIKEQMLQQQALEQQNAKQPAVTKDGVQILVSGNASTLAEAQQAQANGAEGLGLVRTEFLFYKKEQEPSQTEQHTLYQQIADTCGTHHITLRTLDVGGDKPVSYIPLPPEENPIVGLRGIRNYDKYRELFLNQIRAMLQVKARGPLHIMLPMVSFVKELQDYKKIIEEEKKKLGISTPVSIGIMVEVPSAALLAEQFAALADFFSIGTNDLTQYTLAIDRGHKTLCAQADPLDPAVLRLIDLTCKGAKKFQKPVAVCGAVAGDLDAIPVLVGLGVTELAVSANLIASAKALIRSLNHADAAKLAQKALQCASAQEVRQLVKNS